MNKTATMVLGLVFVSLVGGPAWADQVIDDFEGYDNGEKIGASFDSVPWRRFGAATNDNVLATGRQGAVISGRLSGQYGLFWPNTFGAIRFAFDNPRNLSTESVVGVKMRSDNPETHTLVTLAITDGRTTYATRHSIPLSGEVQDLVFNIGNGDMVLADGRDSFANVISNVTAIGFGFRSTEGQYIESVIFDEFRFTSAAE